MTYDDAIAGFFPGMTVESLNKCLAEMGWNHILLQAEILKIARLGALGLTPDHDLGENVKAFGVSTAKVIQDIQRHQQGGWSE